MNIPRSSEASNAAAAAHETPSADGRSDSVAALHTIGQRAYLHAAGVATEERGALLAGVVRPWDGMTAATIYMGGRTDTRDGLGAAGSWQDLADWMVRYSQNVVPDKGTGAWFTPAVSTNGRCRDQDISCVSQISFDCDGAGDWYAIRRVLEQAGLAHILQRSSSHRPEHPKFHLHIPLSVPWAGTKKQWRRVYRHCVGWFSAAAELRADLDAKPPMYGFDAKTDRLGQPWFLPARRSEQDPAPETVVVDGGALELDIPGSDGV